MSASCARSGAEWQHLHVAPGHARPAKLNVKLLERDDAAVSQSATAQHFMVALVGELQEREITTEVWTASGEPPPPALFLFVDRYEDGDPGHGFVCGVVSFGIASCGEGETLVGFRYHPSLAAPTIEGKLRGWAETGAIQDDGDESATAAAEMIACVVEQGTDCSDLPRKMRTKKRRKD
jgi:hypothetical protein